MMTGRKGIDDGDEGHGVKRLSWKRERAGLQGLWLCGVAFLASLLTWVPLTAALPVSFEEGAFLRDAEVEEILHEFADPLLKAAGLSPAEVQIFLVSTPVVNAASAIGGKIFVNTGLILTCESGAELAAVLAHEIGHLQKHHVVTRLGAMQGAATMGMGAMGVGALIAALTGNVGALLLGAAAGQHVAERSFLTFTRGQESEADQASFQLLESVKWPVGGAVSFMKKLIEDRGPLQDSRVVYAQTHPLHEERVGIAQRHVRVGETLPLFLQNAFFRMKVKIRAYTLAASQVLKDSEVQRSPDRAYGETIGLLRQGRLDEALMKLRALEAQNPSPYLAELRAQILFEKGDLVGADTAMREALTGLPAKLRAVRSPLYVLAAQIKIARGALGEARALLEKASLLDPDDPHPWYFLSIVAGKQGKPQEVDLCLAERGVRLGEAQQAREHARRAQKALVPGTPAYIRATDLIEQLDRMVSQEKKGVRSGYSARSLDS